MIDHPEQQYLDLMRTIWETGSERIDRTGIGTRSVCGALPPKQRRDEAYTPLICAASCAKCSDDGHSA